MCVKFLRKYRRLKISRSRCLVSLREFMGLNTLNLYRSHIKKDIYDTCYRWKLENYAYWILAKLSFGKGFSLADDSISGPLLNLFVAVALLDYNT